MSCNILSKYGRINGIYDQYGFEGVIDYVERRLEYGEVTKTQEGLYRIITRGWSEDECLIDDLINPGSYFRRHYVGYICGGAFYFAENMEDNDFEVTKKDGTVKKCGESE